MPTTKAKKLKPNAGLDTLKEMIQYIHSNIMAMNQSKIFAGLVISRDILVFAMAWMGTRDIYTALFMTFVFSICANFIFNEESRFCCLPKSFITHHTEAMENPPEKPQITEQQITDAIALLSKVKHDKPTNDQDGASTIY